MKSFLVLKICIFLTLPLWRYIPEIWELPGANPIVLVTTLTLVAGYGIAYRRVGQFFWTGFAVIFGSIYASYENFFQPLPPVILWGLATALLAGMASMGMWFAEMEDELELVPQA